MKELLTVKHLGKADILKDISFEIREGEMVAVMGPSGSGKSTLLYNVSGMDDPDTGEVILGDTVITGLNEDEESRAETEENGLRFSEYECSGKSEHNRQYSIACSPC